MTTTELGTTWSERLDPRNWTLAWKLIAIGLVPALLALALGVLRISDQAGDAAALGETNRLLEIRGEVAAAADALRQERDEAAIFVAAGRSEDRGVLDIGIGQTDDTLGPALAALRAVEGLDATTTAALAQSEDAAAQLGPLRNDVLGSASTGTDAVVQRYTGVIARVDGLDRTLLRQLRTPDVAGLADALTATTSAREQLAIQHTVLGAAIRSGQLRPSDVAASTAADNRLAAEFSTYQVALTPQQVERFGTFGSSATDAERERVRNLIVNTPLDRPIVVDPAAWDAAYSTALAAVQGPSEAIRDEVVARSAAAEETASNQAGINSVVLMLGLLAGITIAILIARALVRSLRVLRTSALDVAERRLPRAVRSMQAGESPDVTVDPVPLDTRDEVGQVARAFDAVHGQAIRLAADQAALQTNVSSMFVNLSRRSQALVERQLQLIEQLESNEQDPDQLSNLFQLDHLATRMRRNSENLLVLAGTDLAKRNIAPVPMVDVLRAAVSEIEQYQRIVVQAPPSVAIVGRAASDLVHLLAELLDNATNFSPPDSQVVMSTTRTADGSIVVEIADRGVGMIDYELADANQRLSGPSSVDVSASRRMGLFVVGRLGARHDVQVQLSTSSGSGPGAGLTASVTVPAHLVPGTGAEQPARARVGAPQGTASAFDVPPQRAGNGSLSALVAGADGPQLGSLPIFDAGPARPSANGSHTHDDGAAAGDDDGTPPLPTRRPGSSLQADGPPVDAGPASDRVPSVAEQARQDQLAAERADVQRSAGSGPDTAAHRMIEDPPGGATDEGVTPADHHTPDHRAPDDRVSDDRAPDDGAPDHGAPHHAAGAEPATDAGRVAGAARPAETPGPDRSAPSPQQPRTAADNGSRNGSTPGLRNPWPGATPPHDTVRRGAGPGDPRDTRREPAGAERPSPRPSPLPQRRPSPTPPVTPPDQVAPPTAPLPTVSRTPQPAEPATADGLFAPNVPTAADQDRLATAPEASRPAAAPEAPRPAGAPEAPRPAAAPGTPRTATPSEAPRPATEASRPAAAAPEAPRPATSEAPRSAGAPEAPRPAPEAPRPAAAAPEAPPPAAAAPEAPHPDMPGPEASRHGMSHPEVAPVDTSGPGTPAAMPTRPPATASGFEMGETTPIFEEIASAWFRSNRVVPVDVEEATTARPAPPVRPRPAPPAAPAPERIPAPERPVPQPPAPERQPRDRTARAFPAAQSQRRPEPVAEAPAPTDGNGFASTADEGWRAASGVTERSDELTAAGLPKRRPRARLVPGSAGSAVLAPPVSPARSAESVRGRLASYQQGVRQGRESRYRGDADAHPGGSATEPATAGGNHDEERP